MHRPIWATIERVNGAHSVRLAFCLVVVAACGRVGFELAPGAGDARDPGLDGAASAIACADRNLGSAIGPAVATGSTSGMGNDYRSCGGDGNDVTFGWIAPAAGRYVIDLCGSVDLWDSVLSVRDGGCNGAQLACSDDACGNLAGLQGRVMVTLAAGQGIVIVVDSAFPMDDGMYQLAIAPQ